MFDVHQAKRENDWSVCAQRREITVFVPLPLPAKKKKKLGRNTERSWMSTRER